MNIGDTVLVLKISDYIIRNDKPIIDSIFITDGSFIGRKGFIVDIRPIEIEDISYKGIVIRVQCEDKTAWFHEQDLQVISEYKQDKEFFGNEIINEVVNKIIRNKNDLNYNNLYSMLRNMHIKLQEVEKELFL